MAIKTEVGKCDVCHKTKACVDDNGVWVCLECKALADKKPNGKPPEPPATPPAQEAAIVKRTIEAGNKGLALRTIEDMYRFAQYVVASRLAPKSYTTPEQIIIAMQTGAEMGMPPMRSLQSFCVVNGAARMFGDAPLAKVRESKLMEYIKEHIEGKDDTRVAVCETKRTGDPEPKVTKFTVADAKQANLWGKSGPWQQYPERMLTYRARSFNLRDNFPDVLAGVTIAEEYEGVEINGNGFPNVEEVKPRSASLLEDTE